MTTLTTSPLAPLLDRLFDEADAASAQAEAAVADLSEEARARLIRSKTDYRVLYGRLKNAPLAISRETGTLLYLLARRPRARAVVQVTSWSPTMPMTAPTIWRACACRLAAICPRHSARTSSYPCGSVPADRSGIQLRCGRWRSLSGLRTI